MISLISISPNEIELKHNDTKFPLVFEYLGPNRTHGNNYYDLNWYEIINNYNIAGLICFGNGKLLPNSLHISVFEIYEKNKGIGTKTMDYMFDYCKSMNFSYITLQAHNQAAKVFYLRLGFVPKKINYCPYLIKKI